MSRSGYSEDCDSESSYWLYRNAVDAAIRGKRGQRFLRDLLAALDAMPEKALAANALVTERGEVCALGCLAKARGIDVSGMDLESDSAPVVVAIALDVATSLAREVMFMNDEANWTHETPQERWMRVRRWVAEEIKDPRPTDREAAQ